MSTVINTSKRCLLPFLVVAIAASLSSCNSSPTSRNLDSETTVPATTPNSTIPNSVSSPTSRQNSSVAQLRAKSTNQESLSENTPDSTSQAYSSKTTNVTLYTSDIQCQKLIPQKVAVPAKEPVKSAVGKILDERDTSDFGLSGYRVSVKNGIATVDLRISPESKRQIASLSSCEQFALFGSLRKTLTSNNQWKIKEVRFTERGEEIAL